MRVGISRSLTSMANGGIFQYETVFLDVLGEIAPHFPEELVFISSRPDDLVALSRAGGLSYRGLPIQPLYPPPPSQHPPEFYIGQRPPNIPRQDPNIVQFDEGAYKLFRAAGIDLVLLLSPHALFFTCRLPFIMPIYDLNHRLQPEFPEVSAFGEGDLRDYLYTNVCRFATFVLVDSEVGKSDVLRFYGDFIDEDRIRILPYYPPIMRKAMPGPEDLARVRARYSLPARYFFYPAQFWRHKNHALILRAIRAIADEAGAVVPVVFCGSYPDYHRALNFKELEALAKEIKVADRVRYLGLVPEEDMAALYSMSVGLVMPTFFGPTNIPPLEAWNFGRPVIASDIPGMREQIGDAGLLVDPRSAPDLAQAMLKLWRDEALGVDLAKRGRQRLSTYKRDSFVERVSEIILEACERVRTGRTPRYP
jgi:glycosyltransferase involved in cell wall biosynthesis